jgi:hypothetical protein
MGDENKKPDAPPGPQSGFPQKKILYAVIAIAMVILAIVLIAKFGYNVDLLNPASGEMRLAGHQATTNHEFVTSATGPVGTGDESQLANVELQEKLQQQQQYIQMQSGINKTLNDTAMAVIRKNG